MNYVNKRVVLCISMMLVCIPTYLSAKSAAVDSIISKKVYDYRITNEHQQKFLKELAYAKDIPQFLRDNAQFIQNASPQLLEAAYWIAYELNKKPLVEKLLMIIESKGQ